MKKRIFNLFEDPLYYFIGMLRLLNNNLLVQ